jgi:dihydrofolate synthase/folylpolyglutamate synthase
VAIPDQPASLTAHELVKAATPLFSAAQPAASIGAALSAIASADETDNAPVMICGSLYLAGHVLAANGTLPE